MISSSYWRRTPIPIQDIVMQYTESICLVNRCIVRGNNKCYEIVVLYPVFWLHSQSLLYVGTPVSLHVPTPMCLCTWTICLSIVRAAVAGLNEWRKRKGALLKNLRKKLINTCKITCFGSDFSVFDIVFEVLISFSPWKSRNKEHFFSHAVWRSYWIPLIFYECVCVSAHIASDIV